MQKISLAYGDKVNWKAWFHVATRGNLLAEVLAMVAVINSLIEIDGKGVPWISGANTKVIEVVLDKMAHGSSPEEMHLQYPHLSLAQIHAALSYYYEHQAELDADIACWDREVEALRAEQPDSPLRQRLRALKHERSTLL
jgi:uncharacterized protein (DUF433 family)